ncbi:MAG: DUF4912 domain-containing protein [Deltaproteobacteria bacterium]|nr:DUF4912 domain-containing protein [Deltaproteobacteria bacterium]
MSGNSSSDLLKDAGIPRRREAEPASRKAEPLLPDEDLGVLPATYDEDRLVVVPRDPEWLFLVWDVSDSTAGAAAREVPEGKDMLRLVVTDVGGAEATTELSVPEHENRYYARLEVPGVFVRAELGRKGLDGKWFLMVGSERTILPVNRVRPGPARFANLPFDSPLRGGVLSGSAGTGVSGRLLTEDEFNGFFGEQPYGSSDRLQNRSQD